MPCCRELDGSFLWTRLALACVVFLCLFPRTVSAKQPAAPVVPGFERFYTHADSDAAAGGRLLLGELNCTACHKAEGRLSKPWRPKQAPVLDDIGSRVSVSFLRKFIADPQAVKPGTTMPALFAGLPASERKQRTEALAHFLASTGTFHQTFPNVAAAETGKQLFHRIGCAACHGVRKSDGSPSGSLKTGRLTPTARRAVVPLGNPAEKYSVQSLTNFLRNPLSTRASGRMPSLNLSHKNAHAIASWFLKDVDVPANLTFQYYEGHFDNVPDFSDSKPKARGKAAGFDLRLAPRKNNFGMRFEGFLQVRKEGEYTFFLGSDDGSRLTIDGKRIVLNDGHHPYTVKTGKIKLSPGAHPLAVDYMQAGGEWKLTVEYKGPGIPKQPVAGVVTATKEPPKPENGFELDPALVAKGRELFATVGCASCHQLKVKGKAVQSRLAAKPLDELNIGRGCTAVAPTKNAPHFRLSTRQQNAIAAAVKFPPVRGNPEEVIHHTMAAMNCYACHSRGKRGGPMEQLDSLFTTTTKEMGEEGRVPPPLDGVGDKLTDAWMKNIFKNGAKERPYMLTHMPAFGMDNVGHLVDAFAETDRKTLAERPEVDIKPLYLKAAGRKLVGDKAFSCIKCHTFGKYKATGIQSLDLTTLTQRIREDWFYRYMMKPIRYRPGTRMPTPFPGGISTMPDVLDGTPQTQLLAIWTYLKDGNKARVPMGLIRGGIVLKPKEHPIIYRNFIQGLSPRGIAVGYPGGLNLAFDADEMVLSLIWHGAFIDASKHWQGRGQGFQGPLGDHVVSLPRDLPFAELNSIQAAWPKTKAKKAGYEFLGYRLDEKRRPVFRYRFNGIAIEDHSVPVPGDIDPSLKRTFTLQLQNPRAAPRGNGKEPRGTPPALVFLAATAQTEITLLKNGWYQIDELMRVRVAHDSSVKPIVRKNGNRFELLVPVTFKDGQAKFVQEIVW